MSAPGGPERGNGEDGGFRARDPRVQKAYEVARTVVPLVLVAGLMVTAFLLLRHYFYLHNEYTTDSYYYMVLARSMKSGLGYTVRGSAYTLYPPGYSFLIMLASLVIKDMAVAAGHISILGAVFAILFTFLIGKELFGRVAGVLGAAVLTFQPAFLKWACLPMAEGLFTLGFTAAVYLWLSGCARGSRARRLGGAAVGGFALLTRVQGLLLFPLLALILLLYWKDAEISLWEVPVELALVGLPFGIFLLRNLITTGHLTKYSDVYTKHKSPLTIGVLRTRVKTYGWSATLDKLVMGLAYLGAALALIRKWKAFLILFGWIAMFVGFHIFWYWTYERYMVPAIPAIALLAGYFFQQTGELSYRAMKLTWDKREQISGKIGSAGAALLRGTAVVLFAVVIVALAGGFAYTIGHEIDRGRAVIRLHSSELSDDYGGKALFKIAEWLEDNVKDGQKVASDFGPDLSYAYDGPLYYVQPVPSGDPIEDADYKAPGLLDKLSAAGVRYLVVGKDSQPRPVDLVVGPELPPIFAVRFADMGLTQAEVDRLKLVALFNEDYALPQPHEVDIGVFEIPTR